MANSVEVRTVIDLPGEVTVMAIAHKDRLLDAKPIAGHYLRRRYHGDRFQIQNADQFSPTWMRLVDEPPSDWLPTIKKKVESSIDPEIRAMELYDLMAADNADQYLTPRQLAEKKARAMSRTFAPSELQDERPSKEMDYSNGQVRDKQRKQ